MSDMEKQNELFQSWQPNARHRAEMRYGGLRMTSSRLTIVGLVMAVLPVVGCASSGSRSNPYDAADHPAQDSQTARRLNAEGLALIAINNHEGAKTKFQQSIDADLYYAPAHNNLGLALVQLHNYYEAAWEFQCAAKMMPHAPEPRTNLGLLYENLGRLDPAISEYEAALEIDPANIVAMRHASRAYVKTGESDDKLKDALEKLLSIPDSGQWDYWARGQLIRLGRND